MRRTQRPFERTPFPAKTKDCKLGKSDQLAGVNNFRHEALHLVTSCGYKCSDTDQHHKMDVDASHHQQQQEEEEQADYLQQHEQGSEGVWHLLLGGLWTPLDQAVVCKLLCCSQAMADFIHTKCTGEKIVCCRLVWPCCAAVM